MRTGIVPYALSQDDNQTVAMLTSYFSSSFSGFYMMDNIHVFITGFLLALGLIMPLGPQNTFIMSQGISNKKLRQTLPVVITAGICDSALILIAVLGVSLVILQMPWLKTAITVVGVTFLGLMGWSSWRSATTINNSQNSEQQQWSFNKKVLFTLSLSLFNPHAILDTVTVIGVNSLHYHHQQLIIFTASCIMVSWLWFILLAFAGRYLSRYKNIERYQGKVSALIMWGTGLYLLSRLA